MAGKLYTYAEAAKEIGIAVKTLMNNISNNKDKIKKIYVADSRFPYIDQDSVDFLISIRRTKKKAAEKPKPEKKSRMLHYDRFWKVSVFNNKIGKFIVRHVCLTYSKAMKLAEKYIACGNLSRATPH